MSHQQKVILIEVKSKEGIPLLPPFYLYETELNVNGGTPPSNSTGKTNGSSSSEDGPMTDAQKRYLYRLLSDHGYEGERATQEIFTRLEVSALKDVTKKDASELINRLVEGMKQ